MSARTAPAFQFYADDFLAGTTTMTAEEIGVYIRFLCVQWTKGAVPPEENRRTMIVPGVDPKVIKYVLSEKFTKLDDGWKNDRLEQVRAVQIKRAASGKLGGETSQANRKRSREQTTKPSSSNQPASDEATGRAKPNPPSPSPSPVPSSTPASKSMVSSERAPCARGSDSDQKNVECRASPTVVKADDIVNEVTRLAKKLGSRRVDPNDCEFLWQLAGLLAAGVLNEHSVHDAIAGAKCNAKRNPLGFVRQCLTNQGHDVRALLGSVAICPRKTVLPQLVRGSPIGVTIPKMPRPTHGDPDAIARDDLRQALAGLKLADSA